MCDCYYYGYCEGWCNDLGGCMSLQRLIHRNGLTGTYDGVVSMTPDDSMQAQRNLIAGDLRRFEADQRDERHVNRYAQRVGITPEQVRALLDLVFDTDCEGATYFP